MSVTSSCKRTLRTRYFRCRYLSLVRRKALYLFLVMMVLFILTVTSQSGSMTQRVSQHAARWRPSLWGVGSSPRHQPATSHTPSVTRQMESQEMVLKGSQIRHNENQEVLVNDSQTKSRETHGIPVTDSQTRCSKILGIPVNGSQTPSVPGFGNVTLAPEHPSAGDHLSKDSHGDGSSPKNSQDPRQQNEDTVATDHDESDVKANVEQSPGDSQLASDHDESDVKANVEQSPGDSQLASDHDESDVKANVEQSPGDSQLASDHDESDVKANVEQSPGDSQLASDHDESDVKANVEQSPGDSEVAASAQEMAREEEAREKLTQVTVAANVRGRENVQRMIVQKRLFARLEADFDRGSGEDVGDSSNEIHQVFFLKVHKAASTTVMNIMYRFALTRQLSVMLPKRGNVLSETKKYWLRAAMPRLGQSHYNILCNHVVFTESAVRLAVGEDAKFIGIVREPFEQFVSAFFYYRNKFGTRYLARIPGKDPVATYLEDPDRYEARLVSGSFTYNRMSFDFGMTAHMMMNERSVDMYVNYLSNTFDLVMISERFDESMVLMKRLLGWKLQDVLYIKNNVFSKHHSNYTAEQKLLHRRINLADYALYDHFGRLFQTKVENEGALFQEEVATFVDLREKVEQFCRIKGAERIILPATNWTSEFLVEKLDCQLMTLPEVPFVSLMKSWQYSFRTRHGQGMGFPPRAMHPHDLGSGYEFERARDARLYWH